MGFQYISLFLVVFQFSVRVLIIRLHSLLVSKPRISLPCLEQPLYRPLNLRLGVRLLPTCKEVRKRLSRVRRPCFGLKR